VRTDCRRAAAHMVQDSNHREFDAQFNALGGLRARADQGPADLGNLTFFFLTLQRGQTILDRVSASCFWARYSRPPRSADHLVRG
jgi:hypothetical protein